MLWSIEIERCNKLKKIFPATAITSLPALKYVVLRDCNEFEEIISSDSKEEKQQRNLSAPFQQVCFPVLRTIDIKSCNKLKALFSATVVTRLPNLVYLIVKDCNEWEEIISLDSVEVRQLRNLFSPSKQICFPMLSIIQIERCNNLKKIFPATIVPSLPQLVQVELKDCNGLEEIISSDSKEAIQQRNLSEPSQEVCFPNLETISIENCNKLKTVFYATDVTSLPKLRRLDVKDCNEWEEIISLGSREAGQHKSFLAPFQNICYPELESISVTGCNKLKTIFFLTIVSSFPNLNSLFVADCNNLEAIISPNSKEAEQHRNLSAPPHQVTFPKLKSIGIVRCSKLKNLFFAVILSCLPQLNWLYVLDCNELEDIISSETKPLRNLSTFSRQVYFPTLQRIDIERCNKLKTISLTIVRSLPKLGKLSVKDCNALEVMFSFDSAEAREEEQISVPSKQVYLPKLEELLIQRCNKLKTIFSLTIVRRLPELGSLSVYDCNELEEIFSFDSKKEGEVEELSAPSQQVCLPKIYSISIKTCNKLKCIFPFSVACHCSSLRFLDIESCPQLEQIVKFEHKAKSEEGAGVAVDDNHDKHLCFPNLGWLCLKKLPTLTETFPWYEPQNCHLIIEDCPRY